ncbi:hypothetical protein Tco_0018974 [Tanacetum coccineum]
MITLAEGSRPSGADDLGDQATHDDPNDNDYESDGENQHGDDNYHSDVETDGEYQEDPVHSSPAPDATGDEIEKEIFPQMPVHTTWLTHLRKEIAMKLPWEELMARFRAMVKRHNECKQRNQFMETASQFLVTTSKCSRDDVKIFCDNVRVADTKNPIEDSAGSTNTYDEHLGDVDKMKHEAENQSLQSTPQVLPSFKVYTPLVIYPEEVEETIRLPMEVEPLDQTKLEDVVSTSLIHIESCKSPTVVLFDVDTRRISIFTVNTKEYHFDVLAISQG